MSYTIEYAKMAFVEEVEGEKQYYLFIRQGDNNVYDVHTNQRARDWNLVATGTGKTIWKEIGARAGCVDGGGLQKAKGWSGAEWMSIEEYIKAYRSKIKNAKPLETFFAYFTLSVDIYLHEDHAEDPEVKKLKGLVDKYSMMSIGTDYYDEKLHGFRIHVRDLDTLRVFLHNAPRGRQKGYRIRYHLDKITRRR